MSNGNKKLSERFKQSKQSQRLRNINALKDTEYSSIYSFTAFLASIISIFINYYVKSDNIRNVAEFLNMCVMLFFIIHFINSARRQCENSKKPKHSPLVSISTNVSYLSPVIYCFGCTSTLNIGKNMKLFLTSIVVILTFIVLGTPWLKQR